MNLNVADSSIFIDDTKKYSDKGYVPDLNVQNWKEFRVGDILNCDSTTFSIKDDLLDGDTPFISRTAENNGIDGFVEIESDKITDGNCLTIGAEGIYAFYQAEPFATGNKVYQIRRPNMNSYIGLFLATVLNLEDYRYSYGRARIMSKLKEEVIKLPVDADGNPDWHFMEDYIKSLHHKPLTTKNTKEHTLSLNVLEWKEFIFTDIFILKGGFYNKKPEHSVNGRIPFLASTENNNGVTEYYSIEDINRWDKVGNEDNTLNKKIYSGNCIAVTVNGSVCNAFYQKEDFTCSHDITAFYLKHHELTPALAMFLCTIIMEDKYRWSYGRKPHDVKKFGKSMIKLPVDAKGNPDWQFMENYIKSLPYGDRLEG